MSIDFGGAAKLAIKPLDDTNYFNWSFRMETLLKHKGIWKSICEDRPVVVAAEAGSAEAAAAWDKDDQQALTFMRMSIGDDQIKHIRSIQAAKAAWNALKEVHERDTPGTKYDCCEKSSERSLTKAIIFSNTSTRWSRSSSD